MSTFVARELAPARARSGRKVLNAFFQDDRGFCYRDGLAVSPAGASALSIGNGVKLFECGRGLYCYRH
jgi:hypothetical protein